MKVFYHHHHHGSFALELKVWFDYNFYRESYPDARGYLASPAYCGLPQALTTVHDLSPSGPYMRQPVLPSL